MAASGLPYLRSLVLVSLILSVSSASHVLAAGHLPAPSVILLFGVLLLLPTMMLARRTLSFRASLLAMGAGQLLLHNLFGMTSVSAACRSSSVMPGHHAAFELACSPVASDEMGLVGGPIMLLAHGVASVLLAVVVSKSDAAATLLRAWLQPLLTLPAVAPLTPPSHRTLVAVPAPVAPLSVHASVPTLRGPPRPVALPA